MLAFVFVIVLVFVFYVEMIKIRVKAKDWKAREEIMCLFMRLKRPSKQGELRKINKKR